MKINFKAELYQKLLEEARCNNTSIPSLVVEVLNSRYANQENTTDSNIGVNDGKERSGIPSDTKTGYPEEEDL